MINSRDIKDLHSTVAGKAYTFVERCRQAGIDLLVTSTYRDKQSQDALYAQGRIGSTAGGKIITNAKGGQSFHNYRVALDVVPTRNGKPVWGTTSPEDEALWAKVGEIGEACGLTWSGRWKGKMREMAHFQYTSGLSLADFQNGKTF